uniref:Secreted protein n=1 Tax=Timema shepardi TaxID=629360 RepID=A0A7R9AME5_TIMSH|nr:unnamed protein product [Timema shepardi]
MAGSPSDCLLPPSGRSAILFCLLLALFDAAKTSTAGGALYSAPTVVTFISSQGCVQLFNYYKLVKLRAIN